MVRMRYAKLGVVAIVAATVVSIPAAGAAAKPPNKPKPVLTVKGLTLEPSPAQSISRRFPSVVLESDRMGQFGLDFKVKNVGKGRLSKGEAYIFFGGKKFDTEPLGPIAPGHTATVRKSYSLRFKGLGLYDAHVCTDAGNCSKHIRFSVVPRRWSVESFTTGPNSLSGGAPFFTARSEDMTFDYYGTIVDLGDGTVYFTWLASGSVFGEVTGDDGVCTYSGSGGAAHSPWDIVPPVVGYLEISTELDGYFAEVRDENRTFSSTQTCPEFGSNDAEQFIPTLETISQEGRVDQPMSPRTTTLTGRYAIPTGFGHGFNVGQWSFKAGVQ